MYSATCASARRGKIASSPWLLSRGRSDRALLLADLPQPPCGLSVLCLGARRPLLLVKEVCPARICNVWRGGKPHKGFCTLLRAAGRWPEDRHPQVHQRAVVAVESCCHEPRVEAVRRHPGPIEPSRQFSREQDVGQLGFAVAAKAPIGAVGVEIVDRDACSLMAGPLSKAGCPRQQRRRDVRNTAAEEGRQ